MLIFELTSSNSFPPAISCYEFVILGPHVKVSGTCYRARLMNLDVFVHYTVFALGNRGRQDGIRLPARHNQASKAATTSAHSIRKNLIHLLKRQERYNLFERMLSHHDASAEHLHSWAETLMLSIKHDSQWSESAVNAE